MVFASVITLEIQLSHTDKISNSVSFGILQATRTQDSKNRIYFLPSCGRTLFDLQETTAKIRAVTNHLKGVKIAFGMYRKWSGEMADADFGIFFCRQWGCKNNLYRGKEVVKRNVNSEVAVDELINLLKESAHGLSQLPDKLIIIVFLKSPNIQKLGDFYFFILIFEIIRK